jgi:hypothetical protein
MTPSDRRHVPAVRSARDHVSRFQRLRAVFRRDGARFAAAFRPFGFAARVFAAFGPFGFAARAFAAAGRAVLAGAARPLLFFAVRRAAAGFAGRRAGVRFAAADAAGRFLADGADAVRFAADAGRDVFGAAGLDDGVTSDGMAADGA